MKIVLPLLVLLIIGLVMVYDASVAEAERLFQNKYHFVERQAVWVLSGLGLMAILARLPTLWIRRIGPATFATTMILLVMVLIPGVGSKAQGAQRWIQLGWLRFQPSEAVKLTGVMYLAGWLEKKIRPLHFYALISVLGGLLILQPDLGTAVVITMTGFLMFFVSGAPLKPLIIGGTLAAVAISTLVLTSPYRLNRVKSFIDPTSDTLGTSYHINQALISLGSGSWFGLGLGRSRQKFQYLPEATTDSVFAIIGEEIGFIGASMVLLLYGALFYQLYRIVLREPNDFRRLLATGLVGWLVTQAVINVGAMVALLPLTGVPLPFISYGGSSMISQLLSLGILMRISLTQK